MVTPLPLPKYCRAAAAHCLAWTDAVLVENRYTTQRESCSLWKIHLCYAPKCLYCCSSLRCHLTQVGERWRAQHEAFFMNRRLGKDNLCATWTCAIQSTFFPSLTSEAHGPPTSPHKLNKPVEDHTFEDKPLTLWVLKTSSCKTYMPRTVPTYQYIRPLLSKMTA